MKIAVIGLGYVGTANAVLMAKDNEVVAVDICPDKVNMLNSGKSPVKDSLIEEYLKTKKLNLNASTNLPKSIKQANYTIIALPTNYSDELESFDTAIIEKVSEQVLLENPETCIVIKSTVPVGFTKRLQKKLNTKNIIFSPEFLREGKALYDNLHPNRIIVGEKSERAEIFASLLAKAADKENIQTLFTDPSEAEAIKLFSNTYLAMRVAFFNELDNFALTNNLAPSQIINGICSDPRIGFHYNNPSFGYGGYCLPKDTKQLLSNYKNIPQDLLSSIVKSNTTRKRFIANIVEKRNPKTVGVFGLSMKQGSDNSRESAILDVAAILGKRGTKIIIYDPSIKHLDNPDFELVTNLADFIEKSDVILCNRSNKLLEGYESKVITRDIFGRD